MNPISPTPQWLKYQNRRKKRQIRLRRVRLLFYTLTFALMASLIYGSMPVLENRTDFPHHDAARQDKPAAPEPKWHKTDIRKVLSGIPLNELAQKQIEQTINGENYRIDTYLNPDLQKDVLNYVANARKKGRGRPGQLAIVVIDPDTGQVMAMAGYDQDDATMNPCLSSSFPAASVFKIITAAAAIETCGLKPDSRLMFNGSKYTLYRSQLKKRRNKYTSYVTFKDSFAQSINPIFGKLGANRLGPKSIETYATAFAFNSPINFEVPTEESSITITDSPRPYHMAEIASGFNRETVISPLHGAMISAAIINQGKLPEPTIVKRVVDSDGELLYQSQVKVMQQAIKPSTSASIKQLMHKTIESGTARKAFRGYQRDKILSTLNIGGKTGSISNRSHSIKYDWFIGFAENKNVNGKNVDGSKQKLAVAVVVGHRKYLGTRASQYARMIMKTYFTQIKTHSIKTSDIVANLK